MPTHYLLDTNICIYIQRKKPEEVLARFQKLNHGDAAISVITWGELLYGAEKSQQRKKALQLLEEFKTFIPVLPIPENAGKTYGAIRASLESQGKPIGNNDLWIAAHAKAASLIVVTNNEQEFQRVPGLKVQNWVVRQDF
jgi:tRNA(fMet)-specific endonuclease VapC